MDISILQRTCNAFKRIFKGEKEDDVMSALPVKADRILTLVEIIKRLWNSLNDPQVDLLVKELEAAVDELHSTVEIDLSDSERCKVYENVRDNFVKILMMQGPEMKLEMLKAFIYEHSSFMTSFNKLKGKELTLQAQRLESLSSLLSR